jgi:hypothetical protein
MGVFLSVYWFIVYDIHSYSIKKCVCMFVLELTIFSLVIGYIHDQITYVHEIRDMDLLTQVCFLPKIF